jgi:hypothetical protein
MKVKNGTASSVSLDMTLKMRSGSAWNSCGPSSPSSMPISPNTTPLAARAKATGKPTSRKTTIETKMIGAMLAIRNSVITFSLLRLDGASASSSSGVLVRLFGRVGA